MDYAKFFLKAKYLFVFLSVFSFFLSSCSKTSQVDFKGERASIGTDPIKSGRGVLAGSAGGFTKQTTASGFTVSASNGVSLNKTVSGTTTNGYKVEYNIQAQMAQ